MFLFPGYVLMDFPNPSVFRYVLSPKLSPASTCCQWSDTSPEARFIRLLFLKRCTEMLYIDSARVRCTDALQWQMSTFRNSSFLYDLCKGKVHLKMIDLQAIQDVDTLAASSDLGKYSINGPWMSAVRMSVQRESKQSKTTLNKYAGAFLYERTTGDGLLHHNKCYYGLWTHLFAMVWS